MADPYGVVARPVHLDYTFTAGTAASRFMRAILQKKLLGQRCPQCAKVYIPPRGSCPTCGIATRDETPGEARADSNVRISIAGGASAQLDSAS